MRSGSSARSRSRSTSYRLRPSCNCPCTASSMAAESPSASYDGSVTTGTSRMLSGYSHSCVRPTRSSAPPNTQTHSVAAGNSETMRMATSGEFGIRNGELFGTESLGPGRGASERRTEFSRHHDSHSTFRPLHPYQRSRRPRRVGEESSICSSTSSATRSSNSSSMRSSISSSI